MKAVIPAAGRGQRLGPLTAHVPKPLLDVGGKTVLERIVGSVAPHVDAVVVVVGYRGDQIRTAVGAWEAGVPITVVEQPVARGTADALLRARPVIGEARFLYAWGDVLGPDGLVEAVVDAAADEIGALAVDRVDDVGHGAQVTIDDGWVREIVEKPGGGGPGWNASGVGVLPAEAWAMLAAVEPSPRGEYELTDVLRRLAHDRRLRAVVADGPVIDVGTADRLAMAQALYRP